MEANRPIMPDGRTYHTQTRRGDIAPNCLLVGAPERAEMIAKTLFDEAQLVGDHRVSSPSLARHSAFPCLS